MHECLNMHVFGLSECHSSGGGSGVPTYEFMSIAFT